MTHRLVMTSCCRWSAHRSLREHRQEKLHWGDSFCPDTNQVLTSQSALRFTRQRRLFPLCSTRALATCVGTPNTDDRNQRRTKISRRSHGDLPQQGVGHSHRGAAPSGGMWRGKPAARCRGGVCGDWGSQPRANHRHRVLGFHLRVSAAAKTASQGRACDRC
jgi:hypothetical protein